VPLAQSVQYTLVASTARLTGLIGPAASRIGPVHVHGIHGDRVGTPLIHRERLQASTLLENALTPRPPSGLAAGTVGARAFVGGPAWCDALARTAGSRTEGGHRACKRQRRFPPAHPPSTSACPILCVSKEWTS
jgi:hypothetical protein